MFLAKYNIPLCHSEVCISFIVVIMDFNFYNEQTLTTILLICSKKTNKKRTITPK